MKINSEPIDHMRFRNSLQNDLQVQLTEKLNSSVSSEEKESSSRGESLADEQFSKKTDSVSFTSAKLNKTTKNP
jgi:hypothetical protein